MARQTSVEAYHKVLNSGVLSTKRQRVYEILFHKGPMTGAQVSYHYKTTYGRGSHSETVRNRLTELRNMGLAQEVGKVVDSVTGMTVVLWDVTTADAAKKLPKRISRKALEAKLKMYVERYGEIEEEKQ